MSMDLKRVALALYHQSDETANRFLKEASKRKSELEMNQLNPYLRALMKNINFSAGLSKTMAEDYLMYSILLQNALTANMFANS